MAKDMMVKRIEAMVLRYPEPNDAGHARMTVLVRLEAGDGLVGWGEAIAMWPEACKAAATLIEEGLAPLVIGRDVCDTATAWQAMKRHMWWYGEGGIASFALSGIDMALWDAKARALGVPLYRLFGGKAHARLPANASMHVNKPTIEENVREIAGHVAAGFRSVKLGFGKKGPARIGQNPDRDVAFVAAVREALGPAPDIMIDIGAGVRWDIATAIATTRRFEEHGIAWIEEPLHPSDIAGYGELRAATTTLIASGEREWTVEGYRRLVETGTVDVFGIDPGRAEGITGFRKVAAIVGAAQRFVNAHAWSTAITTAASLHLSIASPHARIFELKPLPGPMQCDIVDTPIWHEDGWVTPPEAPGLGIALKEEVIRSYRVA